MSVHHVLWLTERSEYHQRRALEAAPETLDVTILRKPSSEVLQHHLMRAEVLVSERRGRIDDAFLQLAPSLKLIVRIGSLIDDIDLHALKVAGIRLVRQPDLGTIMVAEHCLMMILALLKKLNAAQSIAQNPLSTQRATQRTDENTFAYNWASMGGILGLYGQSVAILGMGEIGVELARRLRSFMPAKVLYYKRKRYPLWLEEELGITFASSIEEAVKETMVVVALLPYSQETDLIIGARHFALMPRGGIFVHAGSGATVDEKALANALNIGHLGGAALDTYEYEPLTITNPLIALAKDPVTNLILTPHIAGATLPREQTARVLVYQEILRFFHGQPLRQEVQLS